MALEIPLVCRKRRVVSQLPPVYSGTFSLSPFRGRVCEITQGDSFGGDEANDTGSGRACSERGRERGRNSGGEGRRKIKGEREALWERTGFCLGRNQDERQRVLLPQLSFCWFVFLVLHVLRKPVGACSGVAFLFSHFLFRRHRSYRVARGSLHNAVE